MGRVKKRPVTRVGYSWCHKGQHEVLLAGFYEKGDGKIRSWCIECSRAYSKEKQKIRGYAKILKTVQDPEMRDYNSKYEFIPFKRLPLDWLTPIWEFRNRPGFDEQE